MPCHGSLILPSEGVVRQVYSCPIERQVRRRRCPELVYTSALSNIPAAVGRVGAQFFSYAPRWLLSGASESRPARRVWNWECITGIIFFLYPRSTFTHCRRLDRMVEVSLGPGIHTDLIRSHYSSCKLRTASPWVEPMAGSRRWNTLRNCSSSV